jgi:predicted DNA-binding ribbon-helix-helix protein
VAIVIIGCATCLVLGGSFGFLAAAFCAMVSDKGEDEDVKSSAEERSVIIAGQRTSVSLEDAFWEGLKDIAKAKRQTLTDLITSIDDRREKGTLSSALRLFVLTFYQKRAVSSSLIGNSLRAGEYTTHEQLEDV